MHRDFGPVGRDNPVAAGVLCLVQRQVGPPEHIVEAFSRQSRGMADAGGDPDLLERRRGTRRSDRDARGKCEMRRTGLTKAR